MESEFSRGNPVQGGEITVVRAGSDEVLAAGLTDDTGAFAFTLPESLLRQPADLEVVVDAGHGHRNSWTVRAQDYAQLSGNAETAEADAEDAPSSDHIHPVRENAPVEQASVDSATIDAMERRLGQMVDKKLDEKLAPLVRAVNHMQKDAGPSVTDVLGGIGFLVGLAGLFVYFTSRRKP
ncbi:MAG: hypothetical protein ACOCWR_08520 [Oceanidesulfovibrio sp.]